MPKQQEDHGKTVREVNAELEKNDKSYNREQYRTYLTTPEWRNVDMADEMAEFLRKGKPFYRYPYFRQILTFWSVFGRSIKAAHDNTDVSWFGLIFSEYTVMNLFIGITTTMECLLKGLLSLPFRLLSKRENNTEFQEQITKIYYTDYGNYIHHTPFYQYPFISKINPIWKAFWNSKGKSFADVLTLLVTTAKDFIFKRIAGQELMQVDFKATKQTLDAVNDILGDKIMYTYGNSIDDTVYIAAKVKTDELLEVIQKIKKANAELKLIHDF